MPLRNCGRLIGRTRTAKACARPHRASFVAGMRYSGEMRTLWTVSHLVRSPAVSRAYRIKVREAVKRVVRARDGVQTQLEILEILPPEQMAELLGEELQRRGFERQGRIWQRREGGVTI